MAKAGRKEIMITQSMKEEAQRLSALGFNEKQISEAIGLNYRTFQDKKEHFIDHLKRGKKELRERIASAMISKIDENDTTALIFICKRLGLFTHSIEATAPTTSKEVLQELSKTYEALGNGNIQESTALTIKGLLESVLKGIEVTELEERIKTLEEQNQKRQK